MDLESHRKIYNTVREACLTGTFDHHNYLSEQNDGLEELKLGVSCFCGLPLSEITGIVYELIPI